MHCHRNRGDRDEGLTAIAPTHERYPDFAKFLSEEIGPRPAHAQHRPTAHSSSRSNARPGACFGPASGPKLKTAGRDQNSLSPQF